MKITRVDALVSLRPGAQWALRDNINLEWYDQDQIEPTEEEILTEMARLEDEYISKEYQRIRATQYPALADQLDMLWHAMDTGALPKVDSFYSAIKAVKDANPKQ
jgi:hypothetical protein